jgi:hypothetical protein
MSSERQVNVLYSVESSSRILLPKVFGQCVSTSYTIADVLFEHLKG